MCQLIFCILKENNVGNIFPGTTDLDNVCAWQNSEDILESWTVTAHINHILWHSSDVFVALLTCHFWPKTLYQNYKGQNTWERCLFLDNINVKTKKVICQVLEVILRIDLFWPKPIILGHTLCMPCKIGTWIVSNINLIAWSTH